jgi:glucose/arabinose dehydrogenase
MMPGGRAFALILGAAMIALAGCGGSSSSTTTKSQATAPPTTSTPTQTSAQAPGAPATSNKAGYGSTEAAWNGAHTPDDNFPAGTAYDTDPSLPQVEGHADARYTQVRRESGRIVEYVYHFPDAPLAAAKRGVFSSQLPADANEAGFSPKATCGVMVVASATLSRELNGKVPNPGKVRVVFNSGPEENAYNSRALSAAALSPAGSQSAAETEC